MISFLVNKYKIILNHSNNLLLFIPWWCVVHDQRPMCNTHAHFIFYKRIFFCLPHSTTQAPRYLLRSRLKPSLHRHVFRSSRPLRFNRHVFSVDMGDFLLNWTPCFTIILKTKKCNLVILWYTVPFSLILSLLSLARHFQYATHGVPPPLCRPRHVPPLSRSDRCTCPLQITNQQPTKQQTKQQTKTNNKRK